MKIVNMDAFVGVVVKLTIGSVYYFISKMITSTCTYGMDYNPVDPPKDSKKNPCKNGQTPFDKTFFLSFVVFASMSLAGLYFLIFRRGSIAASTYNMRMILHMFIPSTLECVAFCIGLYAQILMALSLAMIMKGAKVVFSALFTISFLKRKLYPFHWFSVALCLAGLAIAGGSEYLNNPDSAWAVLVGCSLLLASECMKAFRVIYDEMMMKNNKCDVWFVVAMEGLYSVAILLPGLVLAWLAIPGKDNGSYENLSDTFYRVEQSNMLIVLLATLPVVVVVLAVAGIVIIKHLSGVHNALISVARSVVIWGIELAFFYMAPADLAQQYGKGWGPFSPLRLVGFIMVVVATLMYDEDIKFPKIFYYPTRDEKISNEETNELKEVVILDESRS
jgi:hypothetical protein